MDGFDYTCPNCNSDDFLILDYDSSASTYPEHHFWWSCRCNYCDTKFSITEIYKLTSATVEADEE